MVKRTVAYMTLSFCLCLSLGTDLYGQNSKEAFTEAVSAARRYSSAGLTLQALEILEKYHQGENAYAALAESSRIRFEAQNYEDAAKGYRKLLDRLPDNLTVQRNLLMALYRNYQDAEARDLLSAMGEAVDQDLRALTVRGLLAARQGNLSTAEADLRAAVKLNSRDSEAPYELGRFYLMQEDPLEAVAALREATHRDPTYAQAHYNLGLALVRAGDSAGGQAALTKARSLTEAVNEQRTRYVRAVALSKRAKEALAKGKAATAVRDLEEAVALHPREPNLRALLEQARRAAKASGS